MKQMNERKGIIFLSSEKKKKKTIKIFRKNRKNNE